MITELNEVQPEIVPGAQIDTIRHRINNFRLHGMMESLSRLLIAILEIQSNDTSATVSPSDARDILAQYGIIKGDLEFALDAEVNDAPTGSYQNAYVTLFLSQKEVQRIRNIKVKSVAKDLWVLGQVILGCDSSRSQNFVSIPDGQKISRALSICAKSMARWIGTGENAENVGLTAPAFESTGTVLPDVDADFAEILEPSKTQQKSQLDDVPDVKSGE